MKQNQPIKPSGILNDAEDRFVDLDILSASYREDATDKYRSMINDYRWRVDFRTTGTAKYSHGWAKLFKRYVASGRELDEAD